MVLLVLLERPLFYERIREKARKHIRHGLGVFDMKETATGALSSIPMRREIMLAKHSHQ